MECALTTMMRVLKTDPALAGVPRLQCHPMHHQQVGCSILGRGRYGRQVINISLSLKYACTYIDISMYVCKKG